MELEDRKIVDVVSPGSSLDMERVVAKRPAGVYDPAAPTGVKIKNPATARWSGGASGPSGCALGETPHQKYVSRGAVPAAGFHCSRPADLRPTGWALPVHVTHCAGFGTDAKALAALERTLAGVAAS
jgi:hypothetical protein